MAMSHLSRLSLAAPSFEITYLLLAHGEHDETYPLSHPLILNNIRIDRRKRDSRRQHYLQEMLVILRRIILNVQKKATDICIVPSQTSSCCLGLSDSRNQRIRRNETGSFRVSWLVLRANKMASRQGRIQAHGPWPLLTKISIFLYRP